MSSTEISKKIGINRITISKYLDILYFQKIINKKKIGSVNFWYLEPGIINFDLRNGNYIDLQQKLIISLINGEKEISENIILSIINKRVNLKKIILDICFPVLNTLFELHNRGKIGKTEKIHLMTNLIESINLLKNCNIINEHSGKRDSLLVIVSGDDDSIPICNMINIYAKKIRLNSTIIGNIEKYIDLLRYINQLFNTNKEKLYVCIISHNEMSIKFLYSTLSGSELKERVHTMIFSTKSIMEKVENEFKNEFKNNITSDLATLIETIEKEIK
ncbi:MAG: hypothetical protein H0X03_02755 [Nitrosopumilus sp.]|nr:hypothetical protein [Nitrosopumilus sp.]